MEERFLKSLFQEAVVPGQLVQSHYAAIMSLAIQFSVTEGDGFINSDNLLR